ncbi:MAG: type IV toxin-antitoxin system AbiEi family antitoxin [Acidimicrobiia bacterium]
MRVVADAVADPWPRRLIVAARRLSPGALEELLRRDANWVDEAGNAHLVVPPGLIVYKVAPSEQRAETAPRFSWSSSSDELAEHLLNHADRRFRVDALSRETGWSPGQVSNVLRAFDERGWTRRQGPPRGRGVWREAENLGSLLEAWASHLAESRPPRRLGHRLIRDPLGFLRDELAKVLGEGWAVTGWAGLELTAPFMSGIPSLQIYAADDLWERLAEIERAAGIRSVEDGNNIEFWRAPSRLFIGPTGDFPVVTPPRLYADLLLLGGRGEDGARHLRETHLDY